MDLDYNGRTVATLSGDFIDQDDIIDSVKIGNTPEQMMVLRTTDDDYYVCYYDTTENRWEALDFAGPIDGEHVLEAADKLQTLVDGTT